MSAASGVTAVGHRQPADEVGHPGEGEALQLRVLVQEVVDVPCLVADHEVVGLVGHHLGEDAPANPPDQRNRG